VKYLIAGLGNIGGEYENTRHNIGFEVVNELARAADVEFELERHALRTSFRYKGRQLILIKPTTYMNLSGKAVRFWLDREKISPENLLVIVDDIALSFGTIRLKGKGSDGGHNGLRDIQEELGTINYARLRFGIGSEFRQGGQINYVLGEWDNDEYEALPGRIDKAAEVVRSFCTIGLHRSMNAYNNK
jgi:PTH1 family peptidyl-tRNA hydrolase